MQHHDVDKTNTTNQYQSGKLMNLFLPIHKENKINYKCHSPPDVAGATATYSTKKLTSAWKKSLPNLAHIWFRYSSKNLIANIFCIVRCL